MAIELSELTAWVETEAGQKWLEAQKKGLIDKNKELVDRLKTASGELEKANGKNQKLETDLLKAQAAVNDSLLNKPLAEKLTSRGVFPVLVPELVKQFSEVYGLTITDGNAAGKLKIDGKETTATLDQCIDAWAKDEANKDCFKTLDTEKRSTSPNLHNDKGGDTHLDAIMRKAAGLAPNSDKT